jgi:hypothetical protein
VSGRWLEKDLLVAGALIKLFLLYSTCLMKSFRFLEVTACDFLALIDQHNLKKGARAVPVIVSEQATVSEDVYFLWPIFSGETSSASPVRCRSSQLIITLWPSFRGFSDHEIRNQRRDIWRSQ